MREIALAMDRPWEGNMCGGYKTYFRDGEICTDCVGRRVATPALKHGCYRGSRLHPSEALRYE